MHIIFQEIDVENVGYTDYYYNQSTCNVHDVDSWNLLVHHRLGVVVLFIYGAPRHKFWHVVLDQAQTNTWRCICYNCNELRQLSWDERQLHNLISDEKWVWLNPYESVNWGD